MDNNATAVTHSGSYVGYDEVFEFSDSARTNGYTQYSFDNMEEEVLPEMPFTVPLSLSELRGRLIEQKQFQRSGNAFNLLYKEHNTYNNKFFDELSFRALKTLKTISFFECGVSTGTPTSAKIYAFDEYDLTPILSTLAEKTVTSYDPVNSTSLTTTQSFEYDEHNYQLAKITTTNSRGLSQEELTYYASDSAQSGNVTAIWDTMIVKNMISIPLKKIKKVNSTVTETLINKYDYDGIHKNVQLKQILHSYKSDTPIPRAEFLFSSDDKLLEQQMTNNVKEVYLYGYGSEYPVAKILNTTYSTASGSITQSVLDNPSSDQALRTHLNNLRAIPGAMVSTYTYKPLVGITSETDSRGKSIYYEYDAFNRLAFVRDQDSNILRRYDYKYKLYTHSNAVWQTTGVTRCKPCPANSSYNSNILQNEERDNNSNSSSYHQTRWVDAGASSTCVITADWQNTATPPRCKQASGLNTGEQEQEQRNINPCSSTYNETRWQVTGTNTTACPLPVYAKLTYENYNYSYSNAVHADIVVRFYSEEACIHAVTVSGVTINVEMEGYSSSSGYLNGSYSPTVNSYYHTVASQVELSYDDGSAFRFKDYYLMEGTGYIVVFNF
jgi:hypothetical protein